MHMKNWKRKEQLLVVPRNEQNLIFIHNNGDNNHATTFDFVPVIGR